MATNEEYYMNILEKLYEKYKNKEMERLKMIALKKRENYELQEELMAFDKEIKELEARKEKAKNEEKMWQMFDKKMLKVFFLGLVITFISSNLLKIPNEFLKVLICSVCGLLPCLIYGGMFISKQVKNGVKVTSKEEEIAIEKALEEKREKQLTLEKELKSVVSDLEVYEDLTTYKVALDLINEIIGLILSKSSEKMPLLEVRKEELDWLCDLKLRLIK